MTKMCSCLHDGTCHPFYHPESGYSCLCHGDFTGFKCDVGKCRLRLFHMNGGITISRVISYYVGPMYIEKTCIYVRVFIYVYKYVSENICLYMFLSVGHSNLSMAAFILIYRSHPYR